MLLSPLGEKCVWRRKRTPFWPMALALLFPVEFSILYLSRDLQFSLRSPIGFPILLPSSRSTSTPTTDKVCTGGTVKSIWYTRLQRRSDEEEEDRQGTGRE